MLEHDGNEELTAASTVVPAQPGDYRTSGRCAEGSVAFFCCCSSRCLSRLRLTLQANRSSNRCIAPLDAATSHIPGRQCC